MIKQFSRWKRSLRFDPRPYKNNVELLDWIHNYREQKLKYNPPNRKKVWVRSAQVSHYHRECTIPYEVVFNARNDKKSMESLKVFHYQVNFSTRLQTIINSPFCCVCGLPLEYFAVECDWSGYRNWKEKGLNALHLNGYGVKNGGEVMMTRDHILPDSLGGEKLPENSQTMCAHCNVKKGNKNQLDLRL